MTVPAWMLLAFAGTLINLLAVTVVIARIFQSLVHISFVHTNTVAWLAANLSHSQPILA